MQILVLGAGMMGLAAGYDLANTNDLDTVTLTDIDEKRLRFVEKKINHEKLKIDTLNVKNKPKLLKLMGEHDAVIGAISYSLNYELSEAAIEVGTNFCDMGGNYKVVQEQLKLTEQAKDKNIAIIPDCGVTPGFGNSLAVLAAEALDEVEGIYLRVGGLPLNPKPPLNYKLVFSSQGLINEYVEESVVIRDGEIKKIPSMIEVEKLEFQDPKGKFKDLEAFTTSGGSSTLPYYFKNRVKELNCKTIRYSGYCEKMKLLLEIGFAGYNPIQVGKQQIIPREFLEAFFDEILRDEDEDVVLLRISAKGKKKDQPYHVTYEMIDYYDKKTELTAMMRTTAFHASIISQLMAKELTKKGALPLERAVLHQKVLEEMRKRKIEVKRIEGILYT